jgi:hypothetical protein
MTAGVGTSTGGWETMVDILVAVLTVITGAVCGRTALRLRRGARGARRAVYVLAVVLVPLWPAAAVVIAAAVAVNRPSAKAWLRPDG